MLINSHISKRFIAKMKLKKHIVRDSNLRMMELNLSIPFQFPQNKNEHTLMSMKKAIGFLFNEGNFRHRLETVIPNRKCVWWTVNPRIAFPEISHYLTRTISKELCCECICASLGSTIKKLVVHSIDTHCWFFFSFTVSQNIWNQTI